VIAGGRVIKAKDEQSLKALSPMVVMTGGSATKVKE